MANNCSVHSIFNHWFHLSIEVVVCGRISTADKPQKSKGSLPTDIGRIRLFGATIKKFLVNLKRHHSTEYAAISELAERYGKKGDAAFAVKPTESQRKLQELGDDCFCLVERFKHNEAICATSSYRLLVRLFSEQCVVENGTEGSKVSIKPNKDVPSNSGHKGKGFQMQVMETYSPDKTQPDLITHVAVEAANESDAYALLPAIEDAKKRNLGPTKLQESVGLCGTKRKFECLRTDFTRLQAHSRSYGAKRSRNMGQTGEFAAGLWIVRQTPRSRPS